VQGGGDLSCFCDQGCDLLAGQPVGAGGLAQLSFGGEPLGLGFGDPARDLVQVCAGVDEGLVASCLAVRFGDLGRALSRRAGR